MKKFVQKIQALGQKAAQIKQAVQNVPAQAAGLREAVVATGGQLRQIRSEVQSSVTGLSADSEERLLEMLLEIDGSAGTFREAGFELENVEMEMGLAQRLIVHLEKVHVVSPAALRSLAVANETSRTTHAILSALIKAEDLADSVHLENLSYRKLVVYVGQVPNVRLGWRADTAAEPHAPLIATAPAPAASLPSSSAFGQSSYFESRPTAQPVVAPATPLPAVAIPTAPVAQTAKPTPPVAAPAESGDWKRDALARFKKMPDLTKSRY